VLTGTNVLALLNLLMARSPKHPASVSERYQCLVAAIAGQFMTEQQILERHATATVELLRQFPSLRIQGTFASVAHPSSFRDACPFQLFVNGKPLPDVSITGLPAPPALLGIAVYPTIGSIHRICKRTGAITVVPFSHGIGIRSLIDAIGKPEHATWFFVRRLRLAPQCYQRIDPHRSARR
jgi:hypothetical protein